MSIKILKKLFSTSTSTQSSIQLHNLMLKSYRQLNKNAKIAFANDNVVLKKAKVKIEKKKHISVKNNSYIVFSGNDEEEMINKTRRLRIINFIKHWVQKHYHHDFHNNIDLQSLICKFALETVERIDGIILSSAITSSFTKLQAPFFPFF